MYEIFQHLIPVLKNGQNAGGSAGIIVNMSSILGSMQENTTGGYYPYRTSKVSTFLSDLKNEVILL